MFSSVRSARIVFVYEASPYAAESMNANAALAIGEGRGVRSATARRSATTSACQSIQSMTLAREPYRSFITFASAHSLTPSSSHASSGSFDARMPWNQLWPTSWIVVYSGMRTPLRMNTESPAVVTSVGYSMPPAPDAASTGGSTMVMIGHGYGTYAAENFSIAPMPACRWRFANSSCSGRYTTRTSTLPSSTLAVPDITSMYGSAIHTKSCTSSAL